MTIADQQRALSFFRTAQGRRDARANTRIVAIKLTFSWTLEHARAVLAEIRREREREVARKQAAQEFLAHLDTIIPL